MSEGAKSSEFIRGLLLYALVAYAVYKGYTPEDIKHTVGALTDRVQQYKDMIGMVAPIVVALIDNMFYTKKRTEYKIARDTANK